MLFSYAMPKGLYKKKGKQVFSLFFVKAFFFPLGA